MSSQYELQKKLIAVQNGPRIKLPDGQELDARDVKNGSGGKRTHRACNNNLHTRGGNLEVGLTGTETEKQMIEAMKQSLMEEEIIAADMENAKKRSLEEYSIPWGDRKMPAVKGDGDFSATLSDDDTGSCIELLDPLPISNNHCGQNHKRMKDRNFSFSAPDEEFLLNDKVTDGRATEMFVRCNTRVNKQYSKGLKELMGLEDKNDKKEKKKELKKLRETLDTLKEKKENGAHIDLIKRITSNGEDLFAPNMIKSQEVLELIMFDTAISNDKDEDN